MSKRYLFILLIAVLIINPASAVWWSNSRQYSSSSSVVNPNTTVIILNLSNASGISNSTYIFGNSSFLPNFHSLNFTVDNLTEIPFWLENISNGVAIVRVNVSTATAGKIVNAYWSNNTDDGSASNTTATFIKWHGAATSQFVDAATQTIPYIYEAKARLTSDPATNQIYFGVSNIQDFSAGASDSVAIIGSTTTNFKIGTASRKGGAETSFLFSPNWNQNQYYRVKIVANSTSRVDYYGYDTTTLTQTITTNNPTLAGGLAYYALSGTGEQEFSFIRGMASPDPTWNSWSSLITSPYYATNWTNNYTNDQQTTLSITANRYINFSMTTNTTTTSYYWWLDGINQSRPYNNYTTAFSTGTHTITATFYNSTAALWANKTWYVTLQMVLSSPANGSTIYFNYPPLTSSVNHTWTTAGYPYYNIQISSDQNFGVLLLDVYTSNPYFVQSMGAGTKYWRVRNYDQTTLTYGSFTPWFNYTLVANASTPSGLAGINGVIYEIISGTQTPINGATVYISNSTGTWSNSQVVGSNGYYLFDNLTNNTVYYLTAKATGYDDSQIEYVTTGTGTWMTKDIKLTQCISGQNCFGTQNYVKFIATDFFGRLYPGLSVSVYRGSDITTTYTGTTGTDGSVSFRLTKDQSYTLVFSGSTITTTSITITPGESTLFYVFVSATSPTKFWDNTSYQEVDTVRTGVSTATLGGIAYVNVTYNDSLVQTTSWRIYLNQTNHTDPSAPQINLQSAMGTDNASTSFSIASGYEGESYLINIKATHLTFGNIQRTYGVQFYGTKDGSLNFIPSPIMAIIAILILVFVGGFFDSTNYAQGAGLICVIGWIELGLGMFAYSNMYISVGIGLGIGSVIAIIANMNERNKREVTG